MRESLHRKIDNVFNKSRSEIDCIDVIENFDYVYRRKRTSGDNKNVIIFAKGNQIVIYDIIKKRIITAYKKYWDKLDLKKFKHIPRFKVKKLMEGK